MIPIYHMHIRDEVFLKSNPFPGPYLVGFLSQYRDKLHLLANIMASLPSEQEAVDKALTAAHAARAQRSR